MSTVHLVLPHQLFRQNLDVEADRVVLVEHDLLFRQYAFHAQKLVLHRASMEHHARELEAAGVTVERVLTDGRTTSRLAVARALEGADRVTWHDVVDDWLERDLRGAAEDAGAEVEVLPTPNFLTSAEDVAEQFAGRRTRMAHFYSWQRRRLDVLVDDGEPVGGQWSFDAENRKKLPKGHPVPSTTRPDPDDVVEDAIAFVRDRFPDAPGDPGTFAWPVTRDQADAMLQEFLDQRFHEFGPYEDAISAEHGFVFHAALTPALNIGLLDPADVLDRVVRHAERNDVPLASYEGFVRQLIGWREYMRGSYVSRGRRLRTTNALDHHREIPPGWWTAETGLDPVDAVLRRVLDTGYAHHIERLMVLGNALCLLRVDPDEVYAWFMAMFVDAYDWVMVPNVYAMSQYAAGSAITTKPYVSASSYLRKMSDLPTGDWTDAWDGLFWTFVRDHRDVFESTPRSTMMVRQWDGFDDARRRRLAAAARPWLAD
ncbi:MAG: cryptochrome/photolyase family protein [Aeromicrobium erythreum]